jgi:hypothetical protein
MSELWEQGRHPAQAEVHEPLVEEDGPLGVQPLLVVHVDLLNDDGDSLTITASGFNTGDAVFEAEREAAERTGDDSYVMNDWRPA